MLPPPQAPGASQPQVAPTYPPLSAPPTSPDPLASMPPLPQNLSVSPPQDMDAPLPQDLKATPPQILDAPPPQGFDTYCSYRKSTHLRQLHRMVGLQIIKLLTIISLLISVNISQSYPVSFCSHQRPTMPRLPRKTAPPKANGPSKPPPVTSFPSAESPAATTSTSDRPLSTSTASTHFTRGSKQKKALEAQEDTSRTIADRLQTALLASADDSQQNPHHPSHSSSVDGRAPSPTIIPTTLTADTIETSLSLTAPINNPHTSPTDASTIPDTSIRSKNNNKNHSVSTTTPFTPTTFNAPPASELTSTNKYFSDISTPALRNKDPPLFTPDKSGQTNFIQDIHPIVPEHSREDINNDPMNTIFPPTVPLPHPTYGDPRIYPVTIDSSFNNTHPTAPDTTYTRITTSTTPFDDTTGTGSPVHQLTVASTTSASPLVPAGPGTAPHVSPRIATGTHGTGSTDTSATTLQMAHDSSTTGTRTQPATAATGGTPQHPQTIPLMSTLPVRYTGSYQDAPVPFGHPVPHPSPPELTATGITASAYLRDLPTPHTRNTGTPSDPFYSTRNTSATTQQPAILVPVPTNPHGHPAATMPQHAAAAATYNPLPTLAQTSNTDNPTHIHPHFSTQHPALISHFPQLTHTTNPCDTPQRCTQQLMTELVADAPFTPYTHHLLPTVPPPPTSPIPANTIPLPAPVSPFAYLPTDTRTAARELFFNAVHEDIATRGTQHHLDPSYTYQVGTMVSTVRTGVSLPGMIISRDLSSFGANWDALYTIRLVDNSVIQRSTDQITPFLSQDPSQSQLQSGPPQGIPTLHSFAMSPPSSHSPLVPQHPPPPRSSSPQATANQPTDTPHGLFLQRPTPTLMRTPQTSLWNPNLPLLPIPNGMSVAHYLC